MVKNPPAKGEMQEMWVRSLGWEDTLEEDMAFRSSVLAWKIPRTEEPGGLQSIRVAESQTQLSMHACTHKTSRRCMSLW